MVDPMRPSGNSLTSSSVRLRCRSREYSGIGSWGGRRPRLADYVRGPEGHLGRPGRRWPRASVDCPLIAPTPDYAKLVEAYAGAGERVTKPAELQAAIERAGDARLRMVGAARRVRRAVSDAPVARDRRHRVGCAADHATHAHGSRRPDEARVRPPRGQEAQDRHVIDLAPLLRPRSVAVLGAS